MKLGKKIKRNEFSVEGFSGGVLCGSSSSCAGCDMCDVGNSTQRSAFYNELRTENYNDWKIRSRVTQG